MSGLLGAPSAPADKRRRFRQGLESGKLQRFPGAFSPLVAKLIAELGFEGVYVSGAVLSADLGLPDIGLTTLTEVTGRGAQIASVTDLPTFIDADTGFGETMSAARTVTVMEDAGLAGLLQAPLTSAQGSGVWVQAPSSAAPSQQPQVRAHHAARDAPTPAPAPASHRAAATVRLRFPWGLVAVPQSGVLHIGRDFGGECGCQIAEFYNVSRRHALVRADGLAVVVVDQMSTNGTSVNGELTAAYQERALRHGDTLGFGAHLRVMVEITEDASDHG